MLEKIVYIQLFDLKALNMHHAFDEFVVVDPDIFQFVGAAEILLRQREHLHLAERDGVVLKDRAIGRSFSKN